MKKRMKGFAGFLLTVFSLFLLLSVTEVEATKKKKTETYGRVKVESVTMKTSVQDEKATYSSLYDKTNLFLYKKKYYINIKELSNFLSESMLKFDVEIGEKTVTISMFKPFSDKKYRSPALWYGPYVKPFPLTLSVGDVKKKVKALRLERQGIEHTYLPLDIVEKKLGFTVRKRKNILFLGAKLSLREKGHTVRIHSTGKVEKLSAFMLGGKKFFFLGDLKRLLKGTRAYFGYVADGKKGVVKFTFYDTKEGDEEKIGLSAKNNIKIKQADVISDYYGKFQPSYLDEIAELRTSDPPPKVTANLLFIEDKPYLPLDFFCDFMDFDRREENKEIVLENTRRENIIVLKSAAGRNNHEPNPSFTYGEIFFDRLYEENGSLVSLQAEWQPEEDRAGIVTVQRYDKNFMLLSETRVMFEGELFGGFFRGSEYNFILFGNKNFEKSESKVTYHLVKYDRDFQRLDSLEIRGAYTRIPFASGTVAMAESGGSLVIHTARNRFDRHQSQMSFIVDIPSMTLMNADVIGAKQYNHVSHSFEQRVEIDGERNIYFLDQGDSLPRSLYLQKIKIENGTYKRDDRTRYLFTDKKDEYGKDLIEFPGSTGINQTGFALGNMVQGSRYLLIGGNHIDYAKATRFDEFHIYGEDVEKRDAYLFTVLKSDIDVTKKIRLTDYEKEGKEISFSPAIPVKINDHKYLVLWNKFTGKEEEARRTLCYRYVDEEGNFLSERREVEEMEMTKTVPIVMDGRILWTKVFGYLGEKGKILYTLPIE